ncbi:DUF6133 family protein [Paenibacillus donghaensis]|uniref:Uncharacterized protein n=1 Tax=Paenibacillus donghaensis TaxID=414771 RepID=A0A2Z2KPY6_9BACL|nr:DUF6133 family protein [Paenibacillus donghaensis]ASA23402.1 hypothetical protein B9T62_22905 [Paenibacillus donghaensis]
MRKWMKAVPKKFDHTRSNVMRVLNNQSGEGFVDTAVKILMAVVIGALVLGGLYLLFEGTILPTLTQRIKEMFNYKG